MPADQDVNDREEDALELATLLSGFPNSLINLMYKQPPSLSAPCCFVRPSLTALWGLQSFQSLARHEVRVLNERADHRLPQDPHRAPPPPRHHSMAQYAALPHLSAASVSPSGELTDAPCRRAGYHGRLRSAQNPPRPHEGTGNVGRRSSICIRSTHSRSFCASKLKNQLFRQGCVQKLAGPPREVSSGSELARRTTIFPQTREYKKGTRTPGEGERCAFLSPSRCGVRPHFTTRRIQRADMGRLRLACAKHSARMSD
jgi:hypothetical protein